MPIAITAEQRELAASVLAWSKDRRGDLADLGLYAVAVPEDLGGAGGTLADAAAGLEAAAQALVPGPVLGTVLAGVLLGRDPDSALAKELVPALAEGSATVAVAWDPAAPALGADPAAHLLIRVDDDWFLLPPGHPGVRLAPVESLDLSRPLAEIGVVGELPPEYRLTVSADVRDLVVTLAAAESAGIAAWCLKTAVDYAKVREQFGRPIGSFQAIKHLCAEMLCRAEAAAALAWDAARAADEGDGPQHALAAATAAAYALDAAVENAKDCIQVLGGIGFTWEHDAHRYLRRAVATRQLLGGSAFWRSRAAELSLAGVRRQADADTSGDPAIRVLAEEIAALPADGQRARLVETGLLVPHWPAPYGRDASAAEQLAIDVELDRAGVNRPELVIGAWAAPTILEHGTDEQRARFVGPTLRGEITWCQLFSEPGAGSDLASLRTKAVRADGGWLLSGQKVWTSLAEQADWGICLARTNPDAPRHQGITYFLVDMRAAGIDIRPLREITGETRFNEVFLDEVFLPDAQVVGEVDGGWKLARTTLANERVAMSTGSLAGEGVEMLLSQVKSLDPVSADRIGALIAEGSAGSLLGLRGTLRALAGQDPGPESSVRKLLGVRHRQAVAEAALELCGPAGAIADGPAKAAQHEFLLSRCLSIAGGTTQVLLNVAAERLLGLPRR